MADVPLSDLCLLIVDCEHKTAPKDPAGQHPLIRTTDLGSGRVDLSNVQTVNSGTHAQWTRRAVPGAGDLILGREAPVGGIFRVPNDMQPVLGQRTVLIRSNPEKVDSRYLMYRLASNDIQARMAALSTGAVVPHLNMADIRALRLPSLPSLSEQARIAEELGTFDDLVGLNSRRMEVLNRLVRSIYRDRFGRIDRGDLPAGWGMTRLSEIATIVKGRSYRKAQLVREGGVPFLNLKNVARDGGFRPDGLKRYEGPFRDDQKAYPGDVLVAVTDMTQERRIVAQAFRLPSLFDDFAVPSLDLALLRSDDESQREFLYVTLRFSDFSRRLKQFANGANVLHLSVEAIRDFEIPMPGAESRSAFSDDLRPLLDEFDNLEAQNASLIKVRDLVMSRLVIETLPSSDGAVAVT